MCAICTWNAIGAILGQIVSRGSLRWTRASSVVGSSITGASRSARSALDRGLGRKRETNRLKLFLVDRRDANTLCSIIQENVEPGATIYSDG